MQQMRQSSYSPKSTSSFQPRKPSTDISLSVSLEFRTAGFSSCVLSFSPPLLLDAASDFSDVWRSRIQRFLRKHLEKRRQCVWYSFTPSFALVSQQLYFKTESEPGSQQPPAWRERERARERERERARGFSLMTVLMADVSEQALPTILSRYAVWNPTSTTNKHHKTEKNI